jgi:hypothetical protein
MSEKEKNLLSLSETESQLLDCPAHNLVTIPYTILASEVFLMEMKTAV